MILPRQLLVFILCLLTIASSSAEIAEVYPQLTTSSGKNYLDVSILKVELDSIVVMHSNGGCRLNVESLPAELQEQLGIRLDPAALAYREKRQREQREARQASQEANLEKARKRQRAMITRIVEQQEQELSEDAKIKVIEKNATGYLCLVVYPITVDVTKLTTTALGSKRVVVVGQKTVYPDDFETLPIFLASTKRLATNREYKLRILHDAPYQFTKKSGEIIYTQMYKAISQ